MGGGRLVVLMHTAKVKVTVSDEMMMLKPEITLVRTLEAYFLLSLSKKTSIAIVTSERKFILNYHTPSPCYIATGGLENARNKRGIIHAKASHSESLRNPT